MKKLRIRECKECHKEYQPVRQFQNTCSIECAAAKGRKDRKKKQELAERELKKKQQQELAEKKDKLKARRLAVKPLSYFKSQAQQAFNAFIRERDKDQPCISCGRFHDGQYHAGHYLTIKAHPELRFDEDNCHKQCSACNNYLSGNIVNYKPRLIEKISQERFDRLTSHRELPKWKREDYILIRDEYRAKLKKLLETFQA